MKFEPATPGRSQFLSARDKEDDDKADAMDTSQWPDNNAGQLHGAVGGALPAQDLLNVLQQLLNSGDKDAQGNVMLQVVDHLVNEMTQNRQSVAREACANTQFCLRSHSVSQQRD